MRDRRHATPDETPVYRVTPAEQLADAPITDEELAERLAELERMRLITSQWTPTAASPVRHVQPVPAARPLVTEPVVDLLDAAGHQLDYAYPLLPLPRAGQAARDTIAAVDELRAIVESQQTVINALLALHKD